MTETWTEIKVKWETVKLRWPMTLNIILSDTEIRVIISLSSFRENIKRIIKIFCMSNRVWNEFLTITLAHSSFWKSDPVPETRVNDSFTNLPDPLSALTAKEQPEHSSEYLLLCWVLNAGIDVVHDGFTLFPLVPCPSLQTESPACCFRFEREHLCPGVR